MRLPIKGAEADYDEFTRMVDMYMDAGFNYFDTARVYLEGQSETAIRDCINAVAANAPASICIYASCCKRLLLNLKSSSKTAKPKLNLQSNN